MQLNEMLQKKTQFKVTKQNPEFSSMNMKAGFAFVSKRAKTKQKQPTSASIKKREKHMIKESFIWLWHLKAGLSTAGWLALHIFAAHEESH